MKENVLIAIRGMQFLTGENENDEIETVNRGTMRREDGKVILEYDEIYEDAYEVTHTQVVACAGELLLTRTGFLNVEMDFAKGKKSLSLYKLPFGEMLLGIDTQEVTIYEEGENIIIHAKYSMEINYQFLTDSSLRIEVSPAAGEVI